MPQKRKRGALAPQDNAPKRQKHQEENCLRCRVDALDNGRGFVDVHDDQSRRYVFRNASNSAGYNLHVTTWKNHGLNSFQLTRIKPVNNPTDGLDACEVETVCYRKIRSEAEIFQVWKNSRLVQEWDFERGKLVQVPENKDAVDIDDIYKHTCPKMRPKRRSTKAGSWNQRRPWSSKRSPSKHSTGGSTDVVPHSTPTESRSGDGKSSETSSAANVSGEQSSSDSSNNSGGGVANAVPARKGNDTLWDDTTSKGERTTSCATNASGTGTQSDHSTERGDVVAQTENHGHVHVYDTSQSEQIASQPQSRRPSTKANDETQKLDEIHQDEASNDSLTNSNGADDLSCTHTGQIESTTSQSQPSAAETNIGDDSSSTILAYTATESEIAVSGHENQPSAMVELNGGTIQSGLNTDHPDMSSASTEKGSCSSFPFSKKTQSEQTSPITTKDDAAQSEVPNEKETWELTAGQTGDKNSKPPIQCYEDDITKDVVEGWVERSHIPGDLSQVGTDVKISYESDLLSSSTVTQTVSHSQGQDTAATEVDCNQCLPRPMQFNVPLSQYPPELFSTCIQPALNPEIFNSPRPPEQIGSLFDVHAPPDRGPEMIGAPASFDAEVLDGLFPVFPLDPGLADLFSSMPEIP